MDLTADQVQAVRAGFPVTVAPPETGADCVIVRADVYRQVDAMVLFNGGLTRAEQDHLLHEAGKRAGWDDPEMDVYNDLVPRRS